MENCIKCPLVPAELHLLNVKTVSADIENDILKEICYTCGVSIQDIQAPNKGKREISDARHIAATLIQKYSTLSYDNIGKKFLGGRDHSTIIHSLRATQSLLAFNKEFKAKFIHCETAIRTKFYL